LAKTEERCRMERTKERRTRGRGIMLKNLRRIRERKGLSLRELEAKSGVYRSTINELELLDRGAQGRTVRKLADALGVSTDDLVG
jgi:transcriptional regulator with XRE-family HTH domain